MSIKTDTNELIYAVQLATPKSREHLPYAADAWAALDEAGRQAATDARDGAVERVMALNRGLIVNQSNKWRGVISDVYEYADIEKAVQCGFLAGVLLFDLRKGFSHTTYCGWAIQTEILKEASALGNFRLSANAANDQRAVRKYAEEYRHENGRSPSADEIAQALGMDSEAVKFVQRIPELIAGDGFDSEDETPILEQAHDRYTTDERIAIRESARITYEMYGEHGDEMLGLPIFDTIVREAMA